MYYFGVFSSHLPYILFTVVYMVYMGMFSLMKPKCEEAVPNPTESHLQQVDVVAVKAAPIVKAYVVNDLSFHDCSVADCSFHPVPDDRSRPAVFHPDIPVRAVCFGFSDFSRPPPSLV